jgi:hypothetical protein
MGRRRLTRLLSLVLLAVFAMRALPAWTARVTHHCAADHKGSHTMAGMDAPHPNARSFPALSEQTPTDGCTHCPPAECEVTSPCATNTAAGLPAESRGSSLLAARSAVSLTTPHGATSAAPELLTPPPRPLV